MIETSVGSVVVNSMLPEDMRDPYRVWDKKTMGKTLTELAKKHPEEYKEISHKLLQFGYRAAYLTGGQSFSMHDIEEGKAVAGIRKKINQETQNILYKWYKKGVTSDDPRVMKEIVDNTMKYHKQLNEGVMAEREKEDSPFYRQAVGTGAQKPGTFNSIIGADLLYVDQNNRPIPIPVTHGYSHGLPPAEYFAGAFGARKGSVDLQGATAKAGFLAKQLVQIAHREVVTGDDSPDPYDETSPTGYPVDTEDPDNEGSYLAHPVAGYKRNTLLTPQILSDIKRKGNPRILVRSVTVGGPANGGIYSYDAGVREFGSRPATGDFVGISAVQAVSEPVTQAAISCLHPGTRVRMWDYSVKKLRDIQVGDYVLGSDINANVKPAKVTRIFHQGLQPVYRFVYEKTMWFREELTLFCTTEHKILQAIDRSKTNPDFSFNKTYPGLDRVDVSDPDYDSFDKPEIAPAGIKERTLACYVSDDKIFRNTVFEAERVSMEYIGNMETMDIEVDNEDHLFVLANGLVVSNSKHSGGVISADSGKAISGFAYLNQLLQVPKRFPGGAVHATEDGVISRVEPAPQGGNYIYINGVRHYSKQDAKITAKPGDRVEAGDVLTDGIPNPAMVVKYKGIGEGRRAFVNQFNSALKNAGQSVHRRNLEVLSRGLINYVRLNDEFGGYAPDDVLPYAMVASNWEPRKGTEYKPAQELAGCYLEKPILHYTIGTRLRPSVIKELASFGIKNVYAHKDPPPFEPEMVRGMEHVANDPDWGTRLMGGYQKNSLLEAARRGATSYTEGTSFVPALAFGDANFGRKGAIAPVDKRKF